MTRDDRFGGDGGDGSTGGDAQADVAGDALGDEPTPPTRVDDSLDTIDHIEARIDRNTPHEDGEVVDAMATLFGVLARLLVALATLLVRVGATLLSWLLTGFREILFGEARDDANRWLLVAGDRTHVVVAFVAVVFFGTLGLGVAGVIGVRESDFVTTMFSTIIAGLFSFVPVVIGVNQLALTWLTGTPESHRERLEEIDEFRAEAEALDGAVAEATADPVAFTRGLVAAVDDRADAVVSATAGRDGPIHDHGVAVTDLATRLTERCRPADATFEVLLPMLDEGVGSRLAASRRLRERNDPPPAIGEALVDSEEALSTLEVAGQYFSTLYIQRSLARLSRRLAYTGAIALVAASLVVMIYASGYPPVVHAFPLLLLVSASLAAAFAPFAVLFAHVVRLSTVVQRSAAPGPFSPPR
ncbi:hypothetical protein [Halobaculum limi]|uniref:hypothetical protein n=1 Tax=Halobaculum limi TaxID=3031916 RepID=UPI0024069D0A|nr:hypothetical protein [Halobaculum sp. YSMS11]